MKDSKEIQNELEELSPLLAQMLEDGDGFRVPENYFDFLSESVMEQIKLEPQLASTKISSTVSTPWYAFLFTPRVLGSLAGIAILVVAGLFLFNQPSVEDTLTTISPKEAATYIADNLDDFETNLFIKDNLLEEINEMDLEVSELDLYFEENLEEFDDAILEQLL